MNLSPLQTENAVSHQITEWCSERDQPRLVCLYPRITEYHCLVHKIENRLCPPEVPWNSEVPSYPFKTILWNPHWLNLAHPRNKAAAAETSRWPLFILSMFMSVSYRGHFPVSSCPVTRQPRFCSRAISVKVTAPAALNLRLLEPNLAGRAARTALTSAHGPATSDSRCPQECLLAQTACPEQTC